MEWQDLHVDKKKHHQTRCKICKQTMVCLYLTSLYAVPVSIFTNYSHYNTKQIENSENLIQQKLKVYC